MGSHELNGALASSRIHISHLTVTYVQSSCSMVQPTVKFNAMTNNRNANRRKKTTTAAAMRVMNGACVERCTRNDGWISRFTSQKYVMNVVTVVVIRRASGFTNSPKLYSHISHAPRA